MSADDENGPGRREVARRVFAAEYDDADLSYSESEEERAPNYVVVPTGARVNRLFAVGVLTEVETVSEDVRRGRVVDPTGAFVVYAGQYQPEAVAALERADPPAFVAVTGKARTFQPEDSQQVYASVRPESINEVDAGTRNSWTVQTAEHTLARVATFADALDRPERGEGLRVALETDGVDPALADGIPRAIDHYGTTRAYLAAVQNLALDAARVVAGEHEEVPPLEVAPGEGGDAGLEVSSEESLPAGSGAVLAGASLESTTTETTSTDVGTPSPTEAAADTSATAETEEDDDGAAGVEVEPPGDTETEDPSTEEMYELDEGEREQLQEEFGTEFETGTDIPEAGEAGIEMPESEAEADVGGETDAAVENPADESATGDTREPEISDPSVEGSEGTTAVEADDSSSETESTADSGGGDADEPPSGDDLEDTVVEEMRALDDGDGADRGALVEGVVAEYSVEESAVEEAIQAALMDGRCYESGDDELTPI